MVLDCLVRIHHFLGAGAQHGGNGEKNENSAAVLRLSPTAIPPMMVAAARDTPGTIAIH